ncbi:hypothetical protein GCL60_04055 [Silvanigrella paludirubra]|uniref:DUF2185 domain-containing protein n=1 Tax=Silvanigrella paludirubra TaxID=2499159 RepID=A0A6N6VUA5_9BACT|nr:hypothetical protein [Silvanigrella paludirubra]KAB8039434.1 hypothetical protein GCL60_04055 [Silvanigrella paludirubra]
MKDKFWPFNDEPNVMVITSKNILERKTEILTISHDEDDGMWQFLDNSDLNEDDARILSLKEICEIDETVKELANLPLGWHAWRERRGSTWYKKINR